MEIQVVLEVVQLSHLESEEVEILHPQHHHKEIMVGELAPSRVAVVVVLEQ
jgi:hypothetical protein